MIVARVADKSDTSTMQLARGIVLALMASACGPSFQALYENDARFEHCYALDESGSTALPQKAECWKDWKEHHTFGQTRDRVEYAQSRYVALSQVPDLPTDEAMMGAAPGEVGERMQLTAPTPTSAFAPPPTTATIDAGAALPNLPPPAVTVAPFPSAPPAVDAGGSASRPPSAACQDGCSGRWDACQKSAKDAGPHCDQAYDQCVGACVKH